MSSRFYSKRLRVIEERKGGQRKKRPKSFKTEDAAKKWADAKKISKYSLKNLKSHASRKKKIVIVKG